MNPKIWGIVLAAGFSRRMGTAKMLLPFKEKSIFRHVIDHGLHSQLYGISAVVNADIPELIKEASVVGGIHTILNDFASSEMSQSMKKGLQSVPKDADAAMFLLGDQPLVTAEDINIVIRDYYSQNPRPLIVQASYENQKGHPVLFSRSLFPPLMKVTGDEGGRTVIQQYQQQVYYATMQKKLAPDIDTKADYQALLGEEV